MSRYTVIASHPRKACSDIRIMLSERDTRNLTTLYTYRDIQPLRLVNIRVRTVHKCTVRTYIKRIGSGVIRELVIDSILYSSVVNITSIT